MVQNTEKITLHFLVWTFTWPVGAENLIRPCEQDEWIEAIEWVNSILAMSGHVVAAQTHDPTLGRTR